MKGHLVAVLALLALAGSAWGQIPTGNLSLWLRADAGEDVEARGLPPVTSGNLVNWTDQSGNGHTTNDDPSNPTSSPDLTWVSDGINGLPAVQFDGSHFLDLSGQVVVGQQFTIFVVGTDTGPVSGGGQRELFSNFDHNNLNSSVFLGTNSNLSGTTRVANFTDAFSSSLGGLDPTKGATPSNTPFLLAGESSSSDGQIYLDGNVIIDNNGPLDTVDTATAYTLGAQGLAGGDLWQGDISEVIVYDAALSDADRNAVMFYLENKYNVPEPFTGGLLAMGFLLLVRKDRR